MGQPIVISMSDILLLAGEMVTIAPTVEVPVDSRAAERRKEKK